MSKQNNAMRAPALAATLAAVALAAESASAQQIMTLEAIGAVRMASPEEMRATAAEPARQQVRQGERDAFAR